MPIKFASLERAVEFVEHHGSKQVARCPGQVFRQGRDNKALYRAGFVVVGKVVHIPGAEWHVSACKLKAGVDFFVKNAPITNGGMAKLTVLGDFAGGAMAASLWKRICDNPYFLGG